MDRKVKKVLTTTMMMVVPVIGTMAADIIGKVTDAKSKEALIGATVIPADMIRKLAFRRK